MGVEIRIAFCLKHLLGERYNVGLIDWMRSSTRLREIRGFGDIAPPDSTFSRFFSRPTAAR